MDDDGRWGWENASGGSGAGGPGSVEEPDDLARELRIRELYQAERAARERLEHRIQELGTALRRRHEQYLEMLGKVQEREERAVQRALRQLSRSEERFRLVVEAVQDYAIFLLDPDGTVTTWNRGAEQILGFTEEEAVGLAFSALRPEEEDEEAHRILQRCRTEGRFEEEGWRLRSDGSRFWANETITALTDREDEIVGFVSITRDLTERMRSQRTLERMTKRLQETVGELRERSREAERARADAEEAERRMRFLAEAGRALSASLDPEAVLDELAELAVPALADWILVFVQDPDGADADGAFGPAQNARVRTSSEELVRRLEEAEVPAAGATGIARVLSGDEQTVQSGFEREEPEEVLGHELGTLARRLDTRSAVIVPLVVRNEIHGLVVLGAGASDRHGPEDRLLAEELVRRSTSALDNARLYSTAVEANRAKSEFLAVMSHELRTPLNAIVGYVDLLEAEVHGSVTSKQREHLERIGKSSRHLIQLIEEILSFSRLEAGREEVQIEAVSVSKLMEEVAEMVEPMAREKGLEFRARPPSDDTCMRTDPAKARQILLNLLMNAVKFTGEGWVGIDVHVAEERAVFEVLDTGPGIEDDEMERIFEPFLQGRDVGIGEFGGTGLGLSVSRDLARLLGGDVTVESEPGEGSTFTVTLPLSASGGEE